MKNVLFTLIISFLFLGTLQSQRNYIEYYQLIEKVKFNKKGDSAIFDLKKAFASVDYIHIENLKLGKKIARKNNDKELLRYCKAELAKSKDNLNQDLKSKLDSIGEEDQRVRGRKYSKAKNYCYRHLTDSTFEYSGKELLKSQQLMREWWSVDSSNVEYIKYIISKYGYPSEQLVGRKTNRSVGIILLHYDKDTANHIMGEDLKRALVAGKIDPKTYAWIIDRHLMYAGKPQKFYSIPNPWNKMSEEKKMEYNKNRHAIGLKSLDEIKIIVRGNRTIVK
ncbi:DUF6624 domain-containing protein [Brumimicrobium mesophilum]|uniref:DUF6624 domain-containing protein n=1 Tax=Brumimicrobium mesophilum TaxID=392717 RepID=UPI000D14128C|nr:DUF6624 domain-containing protein [Brumimicrobium mesophilum]